MRIAATSLLAVAFLASGCAVARPAAYSVPKDLGSECAKHCSTLDMRLSAVVIIMNASGCVCEPRQAGAAASTGSAAAAGGAAMNLALQQQKHRDETPTTPAPSYSPPAGLRH
ncbi:MAG TPA: hypothetical protein VIW03_06405 [Anaeromyxobacter sp.]